MSMVVLPPHVRAVRVVVALTERFGELTRKTFGAPDAMSLVIGEAEQIYPEIWSQLDLARKAFAEMGCDTKEFDTIRAYEPRGSLGILDMRLVVRRDRLGFDNDHQYREVVWNHDGHTRAVQAAGALMRAAPDVDWALIAKAEDEAQRNIEKEFGSISSKAWIPVVVIVVAILAAIVFVMRK